MTGLALSIPIAPIMEYRLSELQAAVAGYNATGVPLVALEGAALRPAGVSDDLGLYVLVSWLARATGLEAAAATDALLVGIVAVAVLVGAVGLWLLVRGRVARVYALLGALVVAALGLRVGDVYVVAPSVAFAFVPWFILLWRRAPLYLLAAALGAGGVVLGWAQVVRSHSATAVLLFAGTALALEAWARRGAPGHRRRAAVAAGALLCGLVVSTVWARSLIQQRDGYLAAAVPGYVPPEPRHPFWHSVYIGLGYTDNPFVPAYRDEVGVARVAELAPDVPYLSPGYERILRGEVIRIAFGHPAFFAQNLAAKGGVAAFYFLLFANVGVLAVRRARPSMPLAAGLVVAIAFSSIFGILVVPILPYLSGFAAFSTLFGILAVDAWSRTAAPESSRATASIPGGR